jgi:hypothetical protein
MKRLMSLLVACAALFSVVYAQAGVSSASASRTRSQSENPQPQPQPTYRGSSSRGGYYTPPPAPAAPDEIAVEEIVNYHRHRLPLPRAGQGVAMDLRWGNEQAAPGQPAVLQIGFTTAEHNDTSDLRPLNLALVIDRSPSMMDDDKMPRVKQALHTFIGKLRPGDLISIVVFDGEAEVWLPPTRVGNGQAHQRAIDNIDFGSATNIHAGLMLGYREVLKNFRADYTNRVLLLTDGMTNTGLTDLRRIADESAAFNDRGVDLTTIGLGQSLDNDLLKTLARRGRGLYHFVADSRDIEKVFVNEAQSLMSPVARNVRVEITADDGLRLSHLYGYAPRYNGNRIALNLDDMNNGVTQVVMLRYVPGRAAASRVTVRLSYYDLAKKRAVEDTQTLALNPGEARNFLEDTEVRKNYTIAQLAQALHDMAQHWRAGRYRQARDAVRFAIDETHRRYPRLEDQDLRSQFDVARNYFDTLDNYLRASRE